MSYYYPFVYNEIIHLPIFINFFGRIARHQEESVKYQQAINSRELIGYGNEITLFHHSAEGDFFLIDGDALLFYVYTSRTWQKGQQLHMVYIIEQYL